MPYLVLSSSLTKPTRRLAADCSSTNALPTPRAQGTEINTYQCLCDVAEAVCRAT